MKGNLTETDMTAIAWTVRILNEAGLDVEKTNHAKRAGHGVSFKLDCQAASKNKGFMAQLEAAKDAAVDAPEMGLDGEPIEEAENEC